jgi:hypothetical protein
MIWTDRSKNIVTLGVCVGGLILGAVFAEARRVNVKAQLPDSLGPSDTKVILMPQNPEDPLQFDDVMYLKKLRFLVGQNVSAKSVIQKTGSQIEDWLENLEFTAWNRTTKTITYIHLELQFPDTAVSGPMMVYNPLERGIPPTATGHRSSHDEPLLLRPNEKLTFTLSAKELEPIKRFLALRKHTLIDINRVHIQVVYIIFENGIKWTLGGTYYRPNPNFPHGYERINQ